MKGTLENFDKIGSLHLLWLSQVFASVRSSYLSDFQQKLIHCIAWADEKNAGLPNFPFWIGKKLLSFKDEFSPIFKLKTGQNLHFKLNNFLSSTDKKVVNPAFFSSAQGVGYVKI